MELDNIKLQTTWNDAAGSINNNFSKIKLALASYEGGGGGLDEEELLDYLTQNGYINEITEEMLSEVLGSEGNEGKHLVATEEGLGWEDAETPDWNAQAGEEGFIKNKTHGFESQRGILTNNGDSCVWYSHYGNDLYVVIDGNPNGTKIIKNAQAGNTYRINGGPPTDIEVTTDYAGNRIITLVDNYEYHKAYPVRIFTSVDTLNDIFIPSTIARVTDIPTQVSSDWDAAEEESGYVKNRPFYADWKYKAENIEVTSDTPVTIEGAVSVGTQDYICATIFANGATQYLAGRFDYFGGSVSITINGVTVTFEKNVYSDTVTISTTTTTAEVLVKEFKTASSVNTIAEMYLPSNLAKLDDGYVVAKGVLGQDDDIYYHLPNNASENDADHTLATEGYADLHPRYVEVENTEDIVFPEVEGTPKKMRLRFREGEIFVDSYEAISGSVEIARLGRHSSRHTTPDDEEGVRVKKNGWRIYNPLTRSSGSPSYVLESIYLVLHAERNGYKRYKVMFINSNNGQGMVGTPKNLMGCFGIVGDNYADVRKGHTRETFGEVNCFASQIYALVIDGVYLPFRLTAIREADGMKYGGTPLNI